MDAAIEARDLAATAIWAFPFGSSSILCRRVSMRNKPLCSLLMRLCCVCVVSVCVRVCVDGASR
jgi:hypothetical protein